MNRKTIFFVLLVSLVAFLLVFAGCGTKSETATQEQKEETTEKETETKETEEKAEVLEIGEKATVEGGKVSVTKVTVTMDLASPEANALLLTGEPGEGTNSSTAPSAGDEFLMITFEYENTGSSVSPGVKPVDITLEDKQGNQYDLVPTSGYGGLYNANPIDPGAKASVTAVYEVPEGLKGLVLTYEPFGSEAMKFQIR